VFHNYQCSLDIYISNIAIRFTETFLLSSARRLFTVNGRRQTENSGAEGGAKSQFAPLFSERTFNAESHQ